MQLQPLRPVKPDTYCRGLLKEQLSKHLFHSSLTQDLDNGSRPPFFHVDRYQGDIQRPLIKEPLHDISVNLRVHVIYVGLNDHDGVSLKG